MQKRGQITLFMIIGIVILLGAIMVFYVMFQEPDDAGPVETTLRTEFEGQKELTNYVMACIKPTVLTGLEILRLQGGYIFVPDDVETLVVKDPRNRVVRLDNTGSMKVVIDKESAGNEVPYWVGTDYVDIPSREFMENQLKFYTEYETLKCLNSFKPFIEQGYKIDVGLIQVTPHLDTSVMVDIDLPLYITRNNIEYQLNEFAYTVPIDWKRIHDTALSIAGYEITENYLEYFTTNMISVYSGPYADMLPPMASSVGSLSCDTVSWNLDDVHARFMAIIYKNMPHVNVHDSKYLLTPSDNPATEEFFESLVYDILETDHTMVISHDYQPSWGMNFDITPKAGTYLKGDVTHARGIPMLNQFCSIMYNFKYYVQYPTMVSIDHLRSADIDPFTNSFQEQQGFNFAFPMKAVIYGNQRKTYVGEGAWMQSAKDTAKAISVQMKVPLSPLFCDPLQRASHPITVVAKDVANNQPIEGVDIYYQAPHSLSTCFIDRTMDRRSVTTYPLCHNCQVNLLKDGYVSEYKYMHSDDPSRVAYTFYMEPYANLNLTIEQIYLPEFMKYYYETSGFTKPRICTNPNLTLANLPLEPDIPKNYSGVNNPLFLSTIRALESPQKAVLNIESRNADKPYTKSIIYPLLNTLDVASGRYNIKMMLSGESTINPSTYERDDKRVTISLHPTGKGTYIGEFSMGNVDYDFDLDYAYNYTEIILYGISNYVPSEVIDVDRTTNGNIIKSNGNLAHTYMLDHDCNISTYNQRVSVTLTKDEYVKYLQPTLK